jgi:hypothetical protein
MLLLREDVPHNGGLALAARTMRKFTTTPLPLGGDEIDFLGDSLSGLL